MRSLPIWGWEAREDEKREEGSKEKRREIQAGLEEGA